MRPLALVAAAVVTGAALLMSQPPEHAHADDDPAAAASRELARLRQGLGDTLTSYDGERAAFAVVVRE